MATAKKTPAPKTAAAKPAFPKPAPKSMAKPASDTVTKAQKPIKVGDRVHVTRRNNEVVIGKVTEVMDKPNGRWLVVNTSTDKKKVALVTARVSQVKRV